MNLDLTRFQLIIFGDFGVLTNTPFRDRKPLSLLPGRAEYLAELRTQREQRGEPRLLYAVAGNKGGVAFGLQTEEEGTEEVRWTAEQIGADAFAVSFAHPAPKEGFERYAAPELLAMRKPQPGMLEQLIKQLGVSKEFVLVVGNFSDDGLAAKAAGVAWQRTGAFFVLAEARATVAVEER